MVQTEDQYAYIHFAVLEFIKSGDTEIEAHDLRDYIKRKSDVDATTGQISFQRSNCLILTMHVKCGLLHFDYAGWFTHISFVFKCMALLPTKVHLRLSFQRHTSNALFL